MNQNLVGGGDLSGLDNISSPRLDNISSPRLDNISSPRLDNISSPRLDNISSPISLSHPVKPESTRKTSSSDNTTKGNACNRSPILHHKLRGPVLKKFNLKYIKFFVSY